MYIIIKRLIDVSISAAGLIMLSPVLIITMIALRLTGEGEMFYRQRRLGYKRHPFYIYKFATMLKNSPNMPGGEITLRNDPRLLPFGRFLRRSKINELPQLLNVLRGEMSLVGPRPLLEISFEMYPPAVQEIIYESTPGLTGIGSLVFRDEERLVTESGIDPRIFYREIIYPFKGELETWYFWHRGFLIDLKILGLTAWQVAFPQSTAYLKILRDLPAPPDVQAFAHAPRALASDSSRSW